jgi:6,7-dimethyl-8-ribityllumazine synthase
VSRNSPAERKLDARSRTFAVVAAQWNARYVDALLSGAVATIQESGGKVAAVHRCSGVFELAPLCARVAANAARVRAPPVAGEAGSSAGGIDGIVALGCLIRGGTDHYALLASETTRALGALAVELAQREKPVALAFGVLTCDTEAQAEERKDNGREAALACIEQSLAYAAASGSAR